MGMIRVRKATDQQKQFVRYLVADNKKATEAARLAGYAFPKQAAYELTKNPSVLLLIRQQRQTLYQTDLASLGAETLKQVMLDPDAPASAKVSAARTSLELAGDLSKNADGSIDGRNLADDRSGKMNARSTCQNSDDRSLGK